MKILITGAAGFIGSHLAERLSAQGHSVVGVDNFSPYYDRALKDLNVIEIKKSGVIFIEADLATSDLASVLPNDVEVIFHLAAQPGISSSVSFEEYLKNNIIATYKLVEYATTLKRLVLFVNISTSSVYGTFATGDENTPAQPTSHYGVTKLAAEQLVMSYARDKGFPACSTRLFSVYGERERPEKMYTKLIKSIVEGQEFPLFEGSTSHKRSYTYVGDIIDGLLLVLDTKEKVIGEIFNLGTDEVVTTGEGIAVIEKILGKKAKLRMLPPRHGDQKETSAVIKKAANILGYKPKVRITEGLKRQVDWYLRNFKNKL